VSVVGWYYYFMTSTYYFCSDIIREFHPNTNESTTPGSIKRLMVSCLLPNLSSTSSCPFFFAACSDCQRNCPSRPYNFFWSSKIVRQFFAAVAPIVALQVFTLIITAADNCCSSSISLSVSLERPVRPPLAVPSRIANVHSDILEPSVRFRHICVSAPEGM